MSGIGVVSSTLVIVTILLLFNTRMEAMDYDDFAFARTQMVEEQLMSRDISEQKVLKAMLSTQRHLFVPTSARKHAYEDRALEIGYGQTISQPYIVAFMIEAAGLQSDYKVLEIGTGSGYQAAILSTLCSEVYTIEVVPELSKAAKKQLYELGFANVHCFVGDGYKGLLQQAPFDVIIVTAAPVKVPLELIKQLREGGKLIIPVGDMFGQKLIRITRTKEGITEEDLLPVRFVPMVEEK